MHPTVWKIISGALLTCVLVQQFGRWDFSLRRHPFFKSDDPGLLAPSEGHNVSESARWVYDWKRDGNNHGLNTEQCNSAFPLLYSEIDRSVNFW